MCNPGFKIARHGDDDDFHRSIVCVDKDECAELNACPEYQMCVNTEGSYICECEDGFLDRSGDCRKESAVTTAATGVADDLLTTEAAESNDCLMPDSGECAHESAVTTGATVVEDHLLTTIATILTECVPGQYR